MKKIFERISNCIVEMDEDNIEKFILEALEDKDIKSEDIYDYGLNDGMIRATQLYEDKKYDIPEIIVCADTLNKGINILKKYGDFNNKGKGKILLAVVSGDTHEIGKNIVKIMLEASGYEVIDLGVNQDSDHIIHIAIEKQVEVIGLSSMMTTTRAEMKRIIEEIDSMGLERRPYVIVGGGSITENYAKEINSDGYSVNAPTTVKLVDNLLNGVERK